jgi:hypothetical protein
MGEALVSSGLTEITTLEAAAGRVGNMVSPALEVLVAAGMGGLTRRLEVRIPAAAVGQRVGISTLTGVNIPTLNQVAQA